MKYSELLNVLYGENLTDILNVLNQSIYVTDYLIDDKNSIIVHSGFTFFTHKQKKIDLLYDIENEKIIRQVRNDDFSIPQINGIIATKNNDKYFNYFYEVVLTEILEGNNEDGTFYHLKDPYSYLNIDEIEEIIVIDKEKNKEIKYNSLKIFSNGNIIKEIPLQKRLGEIIFFNGTLFKKYIPYDEYYQDNNYEDYYKQRETYGKYEGTWAQDVEGLSDDFIDDVLGGEPDAYWNID